LKNTNKNSISADTKKNEDSADNKVFKLSLFDSKLPFVFIKIAKYSNNYRISTNYEFLNLNYNLKINYIRDVKKIDKNHLFEISSKNFKIKDKLSFLKKLHISNDNYIKIYNYIDKNYNTSIYIFERVYNNDINVSLLFTSEIFYNINDYLIDHFEFKNMLDK